MAVTYEKRDINVASIARIGFVLTSVVAMCFVVAWWLLGFLVKHEVETSGQPHPLAETVARTEPPPPRLQTDPRNDLLELRAQEVLTLGTYGWIDKEQGIVRIPIARAMELTAERGLRARAGEDE